MDEAQMIAGLKRNLIEAELERDRYYQASLIQVSLLKTLTDSLDSGSTLSVNNAEGVESKMTDLINLTASLRSTWRAYVRVCAVVDSLKERVKAVDNG